MASTEAAPPFSRHDFDVIAFDFDGTLADTTEAIVTTVSATLQALELSPIERGQLLPLIGIPLREAFRGLGVADVHLTACVTRYRDLFWAASPSVTLFPGVASCLGQLRELGFKLAVVSSRGRASLRTLIDQLGVSTHFDLILGEEDAANKKPAPDLVLVTAAHFGVAPDRILVVGDTTYDIEMGHAAGSHTCAVTYGNHDRTRLQMARPHHYTDALTTLSASLSQ